MMHIITSSPLMQVALVIGFIGIILIILVDSVAQAMYDYFRVDLGGTEDAYDDYD